MLAAAAQEVSWDSLSWSAWCSHEHCFSGDFTRERCCRSADGAADCWREHPSLNYGRCCRRASAWNTSAAARLSNPARWFLACCDGDQAAPSDACDAVAQEAVESLVAQRSEVEKWPQQTQLCQARPRLCRRALHRVWKRGMEEELRSGPPGLAKNSSWCVQQGAKLRALDPDAVASEAGSPETDEDIVRSRQANLYAAWMTHCARLQVGFVDALAEELLPEGGAEDRQGQRPGESTSFSKQEAEEATSSVVGILLPVLGRAKEEFAPYFEWWRCYCTRYGFKFFLDDGEEPADLVPPDLQAILDGDRRDAASSPLWGLSKTDIAYIKKSVTPFAWLRWLSAEKHLHLVGLLIVIEPDMVPSPGCGMEIPLNAFAHLCCNGHCICDVVVGDMKPHSWEGVPDVNANSGEDMNTGFSMIRNSPRGHLFLRLVLQRKAWPGLGMPDQDAAGEAVLEMLSLERRLLDKEPADFLYQGQCLPKMFHRPRSLQDPRLPWSYSSADYGMCWHRYAQGLAGPVGKRQSRWIGFAHPWRGNLNARPYFDGTWQAARGAWRGQATGLMRRPQGPASQSAIVLHFAGLGPQKCWPASLLGCWRLWQL
eukprot:TRINITY_DN34282_c0_g1_i2.p1 TRINITY_DN34282_c0_g1~~TRINITY_DN34282_c0_g1_i2.p1  ORF type:complete len:597 (+),score=103.81 TRINITY_DN34282_c0_g1_i2:152-1942(+)